MDDQRQSKDFKLEVIARLPAVPRRAPPLLFVHGTWHAAWCWSEHFLDFFARNGFAVYALSLRGHGLSEGPRGLRFVRIRDFVEDVAKVAASLPAPPILVGHSMGGFIVQKYLETQAAPLAVLLASAPPTGGLPLALRLAKSRPLDVLKANLRFSVWPIVADLDKARSLLFSSKLPRAAAAKFHERLQDDSVLAYLDCLGLDPVAVERVTSPIVVMGGSEDRVVGAREINITAKAYRVAPIVLDGLAHDLMLDADWALASDRILVELDSRWPSRAKAPERHAAA